jgi:transposase
MPRTSVPNAKDVLPKAVLARLQRYCSGTIYIPAPETRAGRNRRRVMYLHSRGHKPDEIARIVGLSSGHVRSIIRQIRDGGVPCNEAPCRVYQIVPQEIVELVQRHISGPIYVPAKVTQAMRRRAIVRTLLGKGLAVKQIAQRCALSERRVWQIQKADLAASACRGRRGNHDRQDPFELDHPTAPSHTPPSVCSVCRSPVGPGVTVCEICHYRAETQREKDTGEIIIRRIPIASIDREF